MSNLYYTAPSDEQFNEVKEKAIEIWNTYDNEFGYVDEKINRIKDIKNVQDNMMFIIAMFDINNQSKLALMLSYETRKAISDRIIETGGAEYDVFKIIESGPTTPSTD